ncbi:CsbD family protein [Mycobacterium barrassiae]|uniref:CsbD family protein n=1 Tax=Mycobacterium barrassiae TaxID=319709 RepID=UPI002265DE45|nr:CsbD family protein [Mycobacterium barrassiae]MCV7302319.1 CsbD family protein [Mycobacterium barrassiae]
MTEHKKADEARKGLLDSVKGKVKEVAGAVTGNDSLTAEGQLEQAQAKERKEANNVEAVADAEAAKAREQAAEARAEGAQERVAVNAETAAAQKSARDQQESLKRAAEKSEQQRAAREKTQAELDAQANIAQAKAEERAHVESAAEEVADAVDDHLSTTRAASTAKAEADRIRRQADQMTNQADLP